MQVKKNFALGIFLAWLYFHRSQPLIYLIIEEIPTFVRKSYIVNVVIRVELIYAAFHLNMTNIYSNIHPTFIGYL